MQKKKDIKKLGKIGKEDLNLTQLEKRMQNIEQTLMNHSVEKLVRDTPAFRYQILQQFQELQRKLSNVEKLLEDVEIEEEEDEEEEPPEVEGEEEDDDSE